VCVCIYGLDVKKLNQITSKHRCSECVCAVVHAVQFTAQACSFDRTRDSLDILNTDVGGMMYCCGVLCVHVCTAVAAAESSILQCVHAAGVSSATGRRRYSVDVRFRPSPRSIITWIAARWTPHRAGRSAAQ